jgi:hypothetical protein
LSDSAPSFIAYIDESGDEGFTFVADPQRSSTNWLVVSAVVVREQNSGLIQKIADEIRGAGGGKRKAKFQSLTERRRMQLVAQMAAAPIRIVNVLVHKRTLDEPESYARKPHKMYFYAIRFLIERVSWMCRDAPRGEGDQTVELVFHHRENLPYKELHDYLQWLALNQSSIHWPVLRLDEKRVLSRTEHERPGLRLADGTANSFFRAVEDRLKPPTISCALALKSRTYAYKGKHLAYGLKFSPTKFDCGALDLVRRWT